MPSVTIYMDAGCGCVLPTEAGHLIQSLFYALLADSPELSAAVHAGASPAERHNYKLFTFSGLRMSDDAEGAVSLEFRSPDLALCEAVADAVQRRDALRVGSVALRIAGLRLSQRLFFADAARIRMLTPVTVHHTREDGFTRYYQPSEPEFARLIAENFARKYARCYGDLPEGGVTLLPLCVGPQDRVTTRFKGTVIKGCTGRFLLRARPDHIGFLYDCGLGDRNSQGFGMFDAD